MIKDDKFLVDINAESILLGQNINDQEQENNFPKIIEGMELPPSEPYSAQTTMELPASEEYNFESSTTQVNQDLTAVKVESRVLGINFSIKDELENKINNIQADLSNVNEDLSKTIKSLNDLYTKKQPRDNFEERVTLVPQNLIFTNRVQKAAAQVEWA